MLKIEKNIKLKYFIAVEKKIILKKEESKTSRNLFRLTHVHI